MMQRNTDLYTSTRNTTMTASKAGQTETKSCESIKDLAAKKYRSLYSDNSLELHVNAKQKRYRATETQTQKYPALPPTLFKVTLGKRAYDNPV